MHTDVYFFQKWLVSGNSILHYHYYFFNAYFHVNCWIKFIEKIFAVKNAVTKEEQIRVHVPLDLEFAVHVSILLAMTRNKYQIVLITILLLFIIVSLSCGGSSSENNTYITQASTTTFTINPCNHKICPVASSICRIRYDFAVSYTIIS